MTEEGPGPRYPHMTSAYRAKVRGCHGLCPRVSRAHPLAIPQGPVEQPRTPAGPPPLAILGMLCLRGLVMAAPGGWTPSGGRRLGRVASPASARGEARAALPHLRGPGLHRSPPGAGLLPGLSGRRFSTAACGCSSSGSDFPSAPLATRALLALFRVPSVPLHPRHGAT